MSELFDGVLAAGPAAEAVNDAAWLQGMLDFESALARAEAEAGVIPVDHAEAIAAQCRVEHYSPAVIGREAAGIGNPAGPLVRALTERVAGPAAGDVHRGATSQDVLDTAAMLVARTVLEALLTDLEACAEMLARLAAEYASTLQAGRTLLQQALPVTFGFTAAGWLSGIEDAISRLRALRPRLAVQFGGAAGTLASLGDRGPAVRAALARRLGLAEPVMPWHTERGRIGELAGALAAAPAAVSKIAGDIVLLAQTEVAEVAERGPEGAGGSSTLPHKHNPVAAIAARAAAAQAPGLVATVLGSSAHEHQRAAGSWHAEWRPLAQLQVTTGSAVSWLRTSLQRLRVDPDRMLANLGLTSGLLAERVTAELVTAGIARLEAHDAVTRCCGRATESGLPLAGLLASDPLVGTHLSRGRIAELLEPASYTGSAELFVQRQLAARRGRADR